MGGTYVTQSRSSAAISGLAALVLLMAIVGSAHAVGFAGTGSLAAARRLHVAATLSSGKVLVAGGYSATGSDLDSAEVYDPATGLWSSAGTFTGSRFWHAASALTSGKALVIGGYNNQGATLSSVELYDSAQSAQNTWTQVASLSTARYYHTATLLLSGEVLVVGGRNSSVSVFGTSELYDPVQDKWTTVSALLGTARYLHTATLLASGKVLVVGGFDYTNGSPLQTAEVYDPVADTWTATTNTLTDARLDHTATLLPSGKVLVAGGQGPLSSAELYDPASNSWSSAQPMHDARADHTATLLSSGLVLVAGGDQGLTALSSAELYDPVSGTWSSAGTLVTGREDHTANLLSTGQVLIAGGDTSVASGGTTLGSAVTYTADRIFAGNFDGAQTAYP